MRVRKSKIEEDPIPSIRSTNSERAEAFDKMATNLCKLKIATEYAQEFAKKFSSYLNAEEKTQIAQLNVQFDFFYYKQWEKLIKKIRGL